MLELTARAEHDQADVKSTEKTEPMKAIPLKIQISYKASLWSPQLLLNYVKRTAICWAQQYSQRQI